MTAKKQPAKPKRPNYIKNLIEKATNERHFGQDISVEMPICLSDDLYNDIDNANFDILKVKITEQQVFNILKNNKKIKQGIEDSLKQNAVYMLEDIRASQKNAITRKKYEEKNIIENLAREQKNKEIQEKMKEAQKKLTAKKEILKETLTTEQKRELKILFGVKL